jgi:NAD(P)H-dependent nitrite reductase small subunit
VNIPDFEVVAQLDQLVEGEGKVVNFHDQDVALFRIGERVYAVENTCPHQGASLAEGWLEGENVSCPWHAWCFSLTTGHMSMGDYASIQVFSVRLEGNQVLIAGPQQGE